MSNWTLEQLKNWIDAAFPDNVARLITEADLRDVLKRTAEWVQETNSTEFIGESIATAQAYAAQVAEDRAAVLDMKDSVETIKESMLSGQDYLGSWDASTNTPALTTSPLGKGSYYQVKGEGTRSITGVSENFKNGDRVVSNGTAWERIPLPTDTALKQGYAGSLKTLDIRKLQAVRGKNLFNKDSADHVNGYFLGSNGSLGAGATRFVSEYIPVSPDTVYYGNFSVGGASHIFYSESLEVLSSFGDGAFTTPSNCHYVRITGHIAQKNTHQLQLGSAATSYQPYTSFWPLEKVKNDTAQALAEKLPILTGKNLFNKNAAGNTEGFFLTSAGAQQSNAAYFITEYISVKPETAYTCTGFNQNRVAYDSDKNILSVLGTGATITTPAATAFIRVSGTVASKATQQIEEGNSASTYEAYTAYAPLQALERRVETLEGQEVEPVDLSGINEQLAGKVNRTIGKNLLDPYSAMIQEGKYIGSSGSTPSNPVYYISAPIAVEQGAYYAFTGFPTEGSTRSAVFDASGSLIETFYPTIHQMPANASYVLVTGVVSSRDTHQVEKGSAQTAYVPYENEWGILDPIKERIADSAPKIVLPSKLFFVKGFESSLYYSSITTQDIREESDIYASAGTRFRKQVVFNHPAAATNATLTLKASKNFKVSDSRAIVYDVKDPATNAAKSVNILFVGDSFTDAYRWVGRCTELLAGDGVTVNQIGTTGRSTFSAEGLSGGRLENVFLNTSAGRARVIDVTGVSMAPETSNPGTKYLDENGSEWIIRSRKMDSFGSGKMSVTKYQATESDFASFPASGVLTKVSGQSAREGDEVINYTNAAPAYFNPFIHHSTGELDLEYYIEFWDFPAPDIVAFQFTINDVPAWAGPAQLNNRLQQFIQAADHVKAKYPDAKVLFSIEPFGARYGSTEVNGRKYAFLKFVDLLKAAFEENPVYSSWVFLVPSYAFVDLENGYATSMVAPSSKYPTITERSSGDSVHPAQAGMEQIGECVYQWVSHLI